MNDYLIIGADAAGLSAAVQIRRKRPQAGLRVINKGRTISYGACGIPYVISGDVASAEKLIHYTPEKMEKERGIKVEVLREAVDINPEAKYVEVKNLETGVIGREKYGRLLIATGATPRRLPFLDDGAEGVFHLHDMEDLGRILAFMNEKSPKTAAVIGAGNIGLELAEALRAREMQVMMIDILKTPIATWPSLVREAVLREMRIRGVRFAGGVKIAETVRRGEKFALRADTDDFEADVIFSVVGVRPAVDFCGGKSRRSTTERFSRMRFAGPRPTMFMRRETAPPSATEFWIGPFGCRSDRRPTRRAASRGSTWPGEASHIPESSALRFLNFSGFRWPGRGSESMRLRLPGSTPSPFLPPPEASPDITPAPGRLKLKSSV